MPLPEKDNDIDTVSPKDVYELPDLCEDCGGVPIGDGVLNIPKFYFQQHGDCSCTAASPDEPIGHDYHRELHEYLVEKGEREE